jgi:hypothetical protein
VQRGADERPSVGIARLAGCGLQAAGAAEDADPAIGRIVEEEADAKLALGSWRTGEVDAAAQCQVWACERQSFEWYGFCT